MINRDISGGNPMSFDSVDIFCRYCRYTSTIDIPMAEKDGYNCKNCGRCLREKEFVGFDKQDEPTEQERLSDMIWEIKKNMRKDK